MSETRSLGLNFAGVKPGEGSEPIPNGWQYLRAERWEETETGEKAAHPGALMFKFSASVVSGEHEKRWVFTQFVLDEESTAFRMNAGRMKGMLAAIGISQDEMNEPDFLSKLTEEWADENLIGKEFDGLLKVTKAKGEYRAGNDITEYRAHEYTSDDMLV